jgi:hypothetical protein
MFENKAAVKHSHTISQAFVFLLLGVFAVMSTLMVLFSAQLYRGIVAQSEESAERRVLTSYLVNVTRGNDQANSVHTENRGGVDVLVFDWKDDESHYETLVYQHDGYLCELFAEASQPFNPDFGEEICPAQAFFPEIQNGMLEMTVTDANGGESVIHLALRSGQEAGHE